MVCDKDVGKMVCDKDACVKDGVTKKEAEEADWDEEPGGTDLKTRTPHKDVGNKACRNIWLSAPAPVASSHLAPKRPDQK